MVLQEKQWRAYGRKDSVGVVPDDSVEPSPLEYYRLFVVTTAVLMLQKQSLSTIEKHGGFNVEIGAIQRSEIMTTHSYSKFANVIFRNSDYPSMLRYSVLIKYSLLSVIILLMATHIVSATVMTFVVDPGKEEKRILQLAVDDAVVIKFSSLGEGWNDNVLDFHITYPNGTVKEDFGKVASISYSFMCAVEGSYELHFLNSPSSVRKHVTLEYEVQHYIFGMPQMLFMTLIIVGVSIAAVAVFVLMGRPR